MKRLFLAKHINMLYLLMLLTFSIRAQVDSQSSTASIQIGTATVTSTVLNTHDVIACTEFLSQRIDVTNSADNVINALTFQIDMQNDGITIVNPPSTYLGQTGTVFTFEYEGLAAQSTISTDLQFQLECEIITDDSGLTYVLVDPAVDPALQNSFVPISYNVVPTSVIFSAVQERVEGVVGKTIEMESLLTIEKGATKNIQLDFVIEEELASDQIEVRLINTNGTEILYDLASPEFDETNNRLIANLSDLFDDDTWDEGDGEIRVVTTVLLDDCSPDQDTFTRIAVRNVCHNKPCPNITQRSYNAVAEEDKTVMTMNIVLSEAADLCAETSGVVALKFENPALDPSTSVVGSGGKALDDITVVVDFDVISFEQMSVRYNGVDYPVVTYTDDGDGDLDRADFSIPQNLTDNGSFQTLFFSQNGSLNTIFQFNFLDEDDNPIDLSNTFWSNIFQTLYENTSAELVNGIPEGDGFDIILSGVRYGDDESIQSAGIKNGGITNFLSVSRHSYRHMCGPIEKAVNFVSNPGQSHIGITGHHPNDNSIYWKNSLNMIGSPRTFGGEPLDGVDLTENARVQLNFDVFEQNLLQPLSSDPDGTYGATEYNPWDLNIDLFGNDDESQIEYWAVLDLPNGLLIDQNALSNLQLEYSTFDGTQLTEGLTYQVDINSFVELGVTDEGRRLRAFPLLIPGVDVNTITKVNLPLALDCDGFNPTCTGQAPELPDGDVAIQIRAYRCAPTVEATEADTRASFENSTYLTTAFGGFEFLVHCNGVCGSPIGTTDGFVMERSTLGWTDETMTTKITGFDEEENALDGSGNIIAGLIKDDLDISHIYPLDEVDVIMTGDFSAIYNPCGSNCPEADYDGDGDLECGNLNIVEDFDLNPSSFDFDFIPIIQYNVEGTPAGIFSMADHDSQILFYTEDGIEIVDVPAGSNNITITESSVEGIYLNKFGFSDAINEQIIAIIAEHITIDNIVFITKLKVNRVGAEEQAFPLKLLSQNFTATLNGTEYISCDPWTTEMTYFNPKVHELHLTVNTSLAHASVTNVTLNQRVFSVREDDFINEFRPWVQWPEELTFEITNGIFDGLTFNSINARQNSAGLNTTRPSTDFPSSIVQTAEDGDGKRLLTFKLEDIDTQSPFFWRGIESGSQSLGFAIRRVLGETPSEIKLLDNVANQDSPNFFFGPTEDSKLPSKYDQGSSLGNSMTPALLKANDNPIVINLVTPEAPDQTGNTAPICWEVNLDHANFVENVWLSVDDQNGLISDIQIEPIAYNGINDQMQNRLNLDPNNDNNAVEFDKMYKDDNGNWIAYLGTINKLGVHANGGFNPVIAPRNSTYRICFYFQCEDVTGDFIRPTLRVGWDCSISNEEIFNPSFNAASTIELNNDNATNQVLTFIDNLIVDSDNNRIATWREDSDFCGITSDPIDLTIDPQQSLLNVANMLGDNDILIDRCNNIIENLDFDVSSIADGDVSNLSVKLTFPSTLLAGQEIQEVFDFDLSQITIESLFEGASVNNLIDNDQITLDYLTDAIQVNFNSNIRLAGSSSIGHVATFGMIFKCLPVNIENEEIVIEVFGQNVCGVNINALPRTFTFNNIYPDIPTFPEVPLVATDAVDNCGAGEILLNLDIESELLELLSPQQTFTIDDLDASSFIISSSNQDYVIENVNDNDLSAVAIRITHPIGQSRSSGFLNRLLTYTVDFSKSCSEDCPDIVSTVSGNINLGAIDRIDCTNECESTVAEDNMEDATVLCVESCDQTVIYSNIGATADGPSVTCNGVPHVAAHDVWFKLDLEGSTGVTVELTRAASRGIRYARLFIWEKDLQTNDLTLLSCNGAPGYNLNSKASAIGLDPFSLEKEYLVSVDGRPYSSETGNFHLCVTTDPSNDFIDGAEPIVPPTAENPISCSTTDDLGVVSLMSGPYSNRTASASDRSDYQFVVGDIGLSSYEPNRDVWFKLDLEPHNTAVTVELNRNVPNAMRFPGLYLWERVDNILTLKAYSQGPGWNYNAFISAIELNDNSDGVNREYFISVDNVRNNLGESGNFQLCVSYAASNDFIDGAQELTLPEAREEFNCSSANLNLEDLVAGPYSNRSATNIDFSGYAFDAEALGTNGYAPKRDVWFKLDLGTSNEVTVEIDRNNVINAIRYIGLYLWERNVGGNTFTLKAHYEGRAWNHNALVSAIALNEQPGNKEYFISVDNIRTNRSEGGNFQVCVSNQASNDFISGAELVSVPNANTSECSEPSLTVIDLIRGPYSNNTATQSNPLQSAIVDNINFDCNGNVLYEPIRDVWFEVNLNGNSSFSAEVVGAVSNQHIYYPNMYLWELNETTKDLNLISCDIANRWNYSPTVGASNLSTADDVTYYVSVSQSRSSIGESGYFQLCMSNGTSTTNSQARRASETVEIEKEITEAASQETFSVYPNPSEGRFTFEFELEQTSEVSLTIYSPDGRSSETIISRELEQGIQKVEFNGDHLSAGIYYYRMLINNEVKTGKLTIN